MVQKHMYTCLVLSLQVYVSSSECILRECMPYSSQPRKWKKYPETKKKEKEPSDRLVCAEVNISLGVSANPKWKKNFIRKLSPEKKILFVDPWVKNGSYL